MAFTSLLELIPDWNFPAYLRDWNPVDFNIVGVSTDNKSTETGTDNGTDSKANVDNVITDVTADKEEEQLEFSPAIYNIRRNVSNYHKINKKKKKEKKEETESTSEIDEKEKQSIYNSLFSDIQFDEQRDGINYYFNKFFSFVQDIFN